MRYLLFIVVSLAMVACSPTETATDAPFFTATARPIETVDSFAGTPLPLSFESGEPIVIGNEAIFNFGVTGEFIEQTDTGTALYSFLPSTGDLPPRNQLYFADSDETSSQELIFVFSTDIEAGQYNLIAPDNYFAGSVTAAYSRLAFSDANTLIQSFSENIVGILTLTSVGQTVSGQFQFTTDFTESSPEGEVDVQSVEVTGMFENIPYQVSLDDPFENIVPLPTRNFDGVTDEP